MSETAILRDIDLAMDDKKNYSIKTEGGILTFRTSSFKAEKSSALHSGVYSREFTSMLFASGICMLTYILLSPFMGGPVLYATLTFALAAAFLLSHKFIFREKRLVVIINKQSGTARLILSGAFSKRTEEIALDNISSVETESKRFEPANKDGADFVQKISVQHGSAVPGLGEVEEFVTLSLKLKDGSERIIYAGDLNDKPELPMLEIKNFLSK